MQVRQPLEVLVAARVCVRVDDFRLFANLKWQGLNDEHRAKALGVDPATYSRVLNGKQAPGGRFIAAALTAFAADGVTFERLFSVQDDEAVPA